MKQFLNKILNRRKVVRRIGPREREQYEFEQQARQQFLRLREKGLNIPIISL